MARIEHEEIPPTVCFGSVSACRRRRWFFTAAACHAEQGCRFRPKADLAQVDFKQFLRDAVIQEFNVIERQELMMVRETKIRCASLLERVDDYPSAGCAAAILGSSRSDGVVQSCIWQQFHPSERHF